MGGYICAKCVGVFCCLLARGLQDECSDENKRFVGKREWEKVVFSTRDIRIERFHWIGYLQ